MANIKKIKIQGVTYDVYDATAIHDLSDIESLGLEGAFIYKGTVATVNDLPKTGMKTGYVYHVTENGSEYVYTTDGNWEEFGHHMVVDHHHEVQVAGSNQASAISGTAAAQTWTQKSGTISGSGSVAVPTVTKEANYLKVTTSAASTAKFVKSYPGVTSKLVTTSVTPAGSAVNVLKTATPTTGTVTGVSGSVTASKATAGTAVSIPQHTFTKKSASKVSVTNGAAASWNATVTDGVLEFAWTANTPTAVSETPVDCSYATTADAISVPQYTFSDVTVPKAATSASTFVTGISTEEQSVATVGTAVTVATGSLDAAGTGASVLTGLGTATTGNAVTSAIKSATLGIGESTDVYAGDTVTVGSADKVINISGTATVTGENAASNVTGTAAAQVFTGSKVTSGEAIAD